MANQMNKQIATGLKWSAAWSLAQPIFQIGFTVILARLLNVSDFGIVAMTMLFVDLLEALFNVGIENSLIHHQKVSRNDESVLFITNISLNLIMMGLAFVLAPLIASFFHEPRLVSIVKVMSVMFLFNALSFPRIILRKSMMFSQLSRYRLSSLVVGNFVGLGFALSGFGYWSLVLRMLSERGVFALILWLRTGWRPLLKVSFTNTKRLIVFGGQIWAGNVLSSLSKNLGKVIIGRFLSVEELGYYSIAVSIADKVPSKAVNIVVYVMGPAFAKVQDNAARLKEYFRVTSVCTLSVCLPALVGLFCISNDFVLRLYGEKWLATIPIFRFVLIWALLACLESMNRALLISQGKGKINFLLRFVELVVSMLTLFLFIPKFMTMGAAYSLVLTSMVTVSLSSISIIYIFKIDVTEFMNDFVRILIPVSIMFALLVSVRELLLGFDLNTRILINVLLGSLSYGLILFFIAPEYIKVKLNNLPVFNKFSKF